MASPYRDDDYESLQRTLSELESELRSTQATAAALAIARERELELTAEVEAARQKLANIRERQRLPLLSSLRVATPCSADWWAMKGDERERHCASCDKSVYNISKLTRDEAEAFLREKSGAGACVRFYMRKDGTILTADCPVGVKQVSRKRKLARVALGGGLALSALTGAGVAAVSMMGSPIRATRAEPVVGQMEAHAEVLTVMGDMAVLAPSADPLSPEPPPAQPHEP